MVDSPKFKKSQAISNTLHLQKYKSPHGVFLDSYEKRDHMYNFIKNKKKIPAPNSYLTTVKLGQKKIKDDDLTTDERKLMRKQRILAPQIYGDEVRFKNSGTTSFGKQSRCSWVIDREKIMGPGPGNYRNFSDFGLYHPHDQGGEI